MGVVCASLEEKNKSEIQLSGSLFQNSRRLAAEGLLGSIEILLRACVTFVYYSRVSRFIGLFGKHSRWKKPIAFLCTMWDFYTLSPCFVPENFSSRNDAENQ